MGAVLHSGSVSQPCLRKALKGSCPRLPQCCTAGVHLVSLTRPQLGVIACPAPRPLSMLSPCLESLLASPHHCRGASRGSVACVGEKCTLATLQGPAHGCSPSLSAPLPALATRAHAASLPVPPLVPSAQRPLLT